MRARLIPVLLLDRDRRLVKTVRFGERTYIGDPFNVIRLFNEKEGRKLSAVSTRAGTAASGHGFLGELARMLHALSYAAAFETVRRSMRWHGRSREAYPLVSRGRSDFAGVGHFGARVVGRRYSAGVRARRSARVVAKPRPKRDRPCAGTRCGGRGRDHPAVDRP